MCDTWQRLRMRCCGVHFSHDCHCVARMVVLGEMAWNGLPEKVMSPVAEGMCCVCWCFSPSSNGLVESVVNLPGPPGKPKYSV